MKQNRLTHMTVSKFAIPFTVLITETFDDKGNELEQQHDILCSCCGLDFHFRFKVENLVHFMEVIKCYLNVHARIHLN